MTYTAQSLNPVHEVELPGYANGSVKVKMRRPSLLALVRSGAVPNPLIAVAGELFSSGSQALEKASFGEVAEVIDIVARAALVEPSFEQLEQEGVNLTDEQLMAIFSYAQAGVRGLEPFRAQS